MLRSKGIHCARAVIDALGSLAIARGKSCRVGVSLRAYCLGYVWLILWLHLARAPEGIVWPPVRCLHPLLLRLRPLLLLFFLSHIHFIRRYITVENRCRFPRAARVRLHSRAKVLFHYFIFFCEARLPWGNIMQVPLSFFPRWILSDSHLFCLLVQNCLCESWVLLHISVFCEARLPGGKNSTCPFFCLFLMNFKWLLS